MSKCKSKYKPIESIFRLITIISILLNVNGFAASLENLSPEEQHPKAGYIISKLLPRYHYEHTEVTDKISAKQLEQYIEILDPNKSYFLNSDIREFSHYRHELDDALKNGQLEPAYLIFNRFKTRVHERIVYALDLLSKEFNFTEDERFQPDRTDARWPEDAAELDDLWRKRLKNEALEQKLRKKNEAEIDSILTRRYTNFERRIDEYDAEDVFQLFMTALAQSYDPHSAYLSPITSDNFGIEMSLSFQGIGASLVQDDVYTKVHSIIPGGPADRGKQLNPNDRIIGVAQGESGQMLDVIGMRLDDVVQKIRGKKGTLVRLQIIPADAISNDETKVISIIRDKVVLKDREAKSDTVKVEHDGTEYTIGVITIPTFYADYKDQRLHPSTYKSTSNDVKRLIEELKSAGMDGLIIDLRNNGGGFLQEAILLSGLFIETGPVVQVKKTNGSVDVERDTDPDVVYDGPLAVIVNRFSASASEIFAAAIQDYDRGVVLGSQTFGKGTVQTLLNLNQFMPRAPEKLGQLKITISKFYRIAGGSTQHLGVIPDIIFPSVQNEMEIGENTEKNALPWDQIQSTNFQNLGKVKPYLNQLLERSHQRTAKNPEFTYIEQDLELYKENQDRNSLSLNEAVRQQERSEQEANRFERENQRRTAKGLPPLAKDEEIKDRMPQPDAVLIEARFVLADLIQLSSLNDGRPVAKDLRKDLR
ncbi:carboxy terminal-processing peptidase [candidate division KSB1 bacterium]|nr:carboxy terminal-processing peptidase [candidate division KSB1 bacterium]